MRPLLFILGLAFVATVLIPDVDAIKCYENDTKPDKPDDGKPAPVVVRDCKPSITKCAKINASDFEEGRTDVYCGYSYYCGRPSKTAQCCDTDLCNAIDKNNVAVTSTPPVPLLIAVIASAIAALDI
ncbi:hypothetical protein AAVH_37500 [Aphelenchoides avenae]|nr:hypothetical protein AAVH_37500 [Aphelenchus avenae]